MAISSSKVLLLSILLSITLSLSELQNHVHCLQSAENSSSALPSNESQPEQTAAPSNQSSQGLVTVVASKYLRPQSDYFVLVTLANSKAPASIDLQLTGARDSNREQTEARSVLVQSGDTQIVKFAIGDWPAAEYFLAVNAQAVDRSWQFQQETPVTFNGKSFIGLIQTDKSIYKASDLVQFRALFLSETLRPLALKNEINVTISDPKHNIVRQWSGQSNWRGLLTLEMPLSEDPMLGEWTILAEARGQQFGKQFSVAEYVLPTFEVRIELPPYATYNDSEVRATVRASYTYGKPVRGHATLSVQPLVRFSHIDTRPLEQSQYRRRLEEGGSADFSIDLRYILGAQATDYFERDIEFFALVEEDLTGRKYNHTSTLRVYKNPIKIELISGATFKPGLSQLVQYKVAYQDDVPVEDNGQQVTVEYSFLDKQVASFKLRPVGGIIEHQLEVPTKLKRFPPRYWSRQTGAGNTEPQESELAPGYLSVKAQYRGQMHYLNQMYGFASESEQYLQISLPQLQQRAGQQQKPKRIASATSSASSASSASFGSPSAPQVNLSDEIKVHLRATEPINAIVHCQALVRSNIVWALSKQADVNSSELEFGVVVDERMAPKARLLCFYVRPENDELIADAVDVSVGGFVRNFVKLLPSRTEAKPGQQVDVEVFTKPNSLVGLLAIDQSVLLLKSGNDITIKDVLTESARFSGSDSVELTASSISELFDSSNLVLITNSKPAKGALRHAFNEAVFYSAVRASEQTSTIRLSKLVLEHELTPPAFKLANSNENNRNSPLVIRSVFPETWLWQNGTADASGKLQFGPTKLPDSITTWQLSAFALSEAHGFGLSDQLKSQNTIRVFRQFFIKLNLPYSVIRGETISIQAVVFNYSKRPTSATVTLDNSRGQFEFIEAANSIEEERSSNKSSETRVVRVPPNDGTSVSFLVRPLKLGALDVKVVAQTEFAGDGVLRKLLVKPEGQVQRFNRAVMIRLARASSEPNQEAQVRRLNVSIEVPANAVRDSQRVQVSAVGDLLGAGLANVDDLLLLPYGCGEQNMINLVPNIVIHNYLLNSRRLRDAQRKRAVRNIETGYQRELNYKRPDGSFSAFGPVDANGSVWLTAYVLRTLQQARNIITVDSIVIRRAANFVTRFARPDGSFEEVGMLHNKRLASASADDSQVYLTAYVLGALFEGPLDVLEAKENKDIIDKALAFLERKLESPSNGAYDLAIMANALQLAGRQEAANMAYDKLWALVQTDQDQAWWSAGAADRASRSGKLIGEPEESLAAGATIPPLKPLPDNSKQSAHLATPDSLAVEASSWALLAAVRRGDLERALPIVRWLISKQNSQGGFASTQDTVLAIEALAAFAQAASLNPTETPLDLEIQFTYPRTKRTTQFRRTESDQLSLKQSNALVQQQLQLDDNITWVEIQATGQGVAVVQVSWQYNLLVSAEEPAFFLNPILDRTSTINYLQLSICTFYKAGEASNMAVVEVELPSGYVADAEALPGLKRHKEIKRVDTSEGETKVIVYLDRVTRNEEICFTVPAHRSAKVSNNKPVPVTIYDYYDRKQVARIFYEPQPASSCDICEPDTCSEQCRVPKRSSKLISLHEQRRLPPNGQLSTLNENKNQTHAKLSTTSTNVSSPIVRQQNVTIPTARELLPLTGALESLKKVYRDNINS